MHSDLAALSWGRRSSAIGTAGLEMPPQASLALPPALAVVAALDNLADSEEDVSAVLAGVGLRGAAPAAIQQDACRRYARGRWDGLLADVIARCAPAPASVNRQVFSFGANTYGVGAPPVGASIKPAPASGAATITRII